MSSYSKSEKIIAVALSNIPFLKRLLKKLYQRLNYLIYKKGIKFNCEYPLKQIGDKTNESFFGYYDKSPVNKTGQYLIFQETGHPTIKKPDSKKSIDIVLFNNILNKEIKRWKTCAYNWQQGAKLMWISDYKFVFNDYNEITDKYFSRIIDVNNLDAVQNISSPIYDANSIFALTLSFERLNRIMPDYGYRNHKQKGHFDYHREGIHKIDLESDTKELLVSIQQIIDLHHNKTMDRGKHWINHIMLSPDGEHFIFLHRWISAEKKFDALILSDTNGNNVKCLADDGMVSHCYWINNSEIVSYMRDAKHGDKYYRINTKDGSKAIIGADVIDNFGDGHPTVFNNKLVFDTYPNRSRLKELFIFDFESKKLTKIGEFFEPLKYNKETRCDLHPKFTYSGKSVFIDSVHTGKRMMYQIDLK